MNLLLLFLAVCVVIGIRSARPRAREVPTWQVLLPAMVVAIGFLSSQRFL
jgi:hypothetical protein